MRLSTPLQSHDSILLFLTDLPCSNLFLPLEGIFGRVWFVLCLCCLTSQHKLLHDIIWDGRNQKLDSLWLFATFWPLSEEVRMVRSTTGTCGRRGGHGLVRERERQRESEGRKEGVLQDLEWKAGAERCSWASGSGAQLRALLWFVIMWFCVGPQFGFAPTLRLFLAREYWVGEQREGGAGVTLKYFC